MEQEQILKDQNNDTTVQQSYQIIEREKIDGTPFELVTNNDTNECFIGFGKYRLTSMWPKRDKEDLLNVVFEREYDFLIALNFACCNMQKIIDAELLQKATIEASNTEIN